MLVDTYSAFTADATLKTDYMNGPLHPNDKAYDLMADSWYEALGPPFYSSIADRRDKVGSPFFEAKDFGGID